MQVQRINVSVVEGNEVEEDIDLDQIFSEAVKPLVPVQVIEKKLEETTEDSIEMEICLEPEC